jgi:hypothetical protein
MEYSTSSEGIHKIGNSRLDVAVTKNMSGYAERGSASHQMLVDRDDPGGFHVTLGRSQMTSCVVEWRDDWCKGLRRNT